MSDLCPVAASVNAMNLEDQPKTIGGSLLWLLESKKFCDVIFTFPNLPDRIEAHEFILKARSPVFEQIFGMRNSGNVAGNEIKIGECTPERFQQFLEFIYADKFEVDIVEALDLLQLSHKYKVQPLTEKCEELLQTEIPITNSVKVFEAARRHYRQELMDRAGGVIVKSFEVLARSDALANAEEETLNYLLGRDDLGVKEVGLFQVIMNWGRNQVGTSAQDEPLRSILKNLVSKIRYTNIDPYEFTKVVVPTGLLSAEETISVYSYLSGDEFTSWRDLKIKFNTSPRKGEMRAVVEEYLEFDKGTKGSWSPAFSKHSLSFKVDRVLIGGKVLPDYLLTKTVIMKVYIWTLDVNSRYREHHVLNLNVLIGDYADPAQAGSFTLRFQKNLLNLESRCWNEVSVEPPLELMNGRTYSVIVENLSTVKLVDVEGFRIAPRVYYAPRLVNPNQETHYVDLEDVSVTLKEFQRKTDYYLKPLPDSADEHVLIGGIDIGLI